MSIFIFTDTTADFPEELKSNYENFDILPLSFALDSDEYDNIENKLPISEFYRRVKEGAVTRTSQPSSYIIEKMLTSALDAGHDVIVDTLSSGISGTYDGVCSVVRELKEKYKDRKIAVIDSLLASGGEGMHCYHILEKRDAGASFEELVAFAEEDKKHICSYFTCTDLKHLARLGRCSQTAAFIGTTFKIMPVMYINPVGKLLPFTKVITRKKALKVLVDKMEEKMISPKNHGKVFITNANCLEDALVIKKLIEEKWGLDVVVSDIGPVIGSHTSAGCVALFFETEDRVDPQDPIKY